MKRIALVLLMGLLLVSGLAAPASAETYYHPRPPVTASGRMTINIPWTTGPDVSGNTELVVWYTKVLRTSLPDLYWIRAWKGNFWPDRNNIDCKSFPKERATEGVKFKPLFWQPATGRNFNPAAGMAWCKEDAYWTTGKRYLTGTDIYFRIKPGAVRVRAVTIGVVNEWTDTPDSTGFGTLR